MTDAIIIKKALESAPMLMNRAFDKVEKHFEKLIKQEDMDKAYEELKKDASELAEICGTEVGETVGQLKSGNLMVKMIRKDMTIFAEQLKSKCEETKVLFECGMEEKEPVVLKIAVEEMAAIAKNIVTFGKEQSINLKDAGLKFGKIVGKLEKFAIQCKDKRDNKNGCMDSQIKKWREEAYGGAAAGVVGGGIGLAISYSIAAGVIETRIKDFKKRCQKYCDMTKRFENTFKDLSGQCEKLADAVVLERDALEKFVQTVNAQIVKGSLGKWEMWKVALKSGAIYNDVIKPSLNKVIDACDEYTDG